MYGDKVSSWNPVSSKSRTDSLFKKKVSSSMSSIVAFKSSTMEVVPARSCIFAKACSEIPRAERADCSLLIFFLTGLLVMGDYFYNLLYRAGNVKRVNKKNFGI